MPYLYISIAESNQDLILSYEAQKKPTRYETIYKLKAKDRNIESEELIQILNKCTSDFISRNGELKKIILGLDSTTLAKFALFNYKWRSLINRH